MSTSLFACDEEEEESREILHTPIEIFETLMVYTIRIYWYSIVQYMYSLQVLLMYNIIFLLVQALLQFLVSRWDLRYGMTYRKELLSFVCVSVLFLLTSV